MFIKTGLFFVFGLVCGIEGLVYYVENAYMQKLNESYFDPETTNVQVVWLNITFSGLAFNLTLLKPLPSGVTGHFNLYLKTMGEYKTHSGISVNLPWCKMVTEPILLSGLVRSMGLAEDNCPPKTGFYKTDLWYPSTEMMPDYFPGIDYKIVFAVMHKRVSLLVMWIFVSLY